MITVMNQVPLKLFDTTPERLASSNRSRAIGFVSIVAALRSTTTRILAISTYLFEDQLRRVLEYNGYNVEHVVNITDVGHLDF